MRVPLAICLVVVVAVAFIAFMHTGARASALCARDGAAVPDGLSVLPPGVRCSGGEPVHTTTKFDVAALLAAPTVALLVFGGAAIVGATAGRLRPRIDR